MVESSIGRMLRGVKQSLPGVGGGLEQLTGVNGDLELLLEEKESNLFLDLAWRKEESETWRVGVQGLDTVVLSESLVVEGVRGWLETDDPEVERPKLLFSPRWSSEKGPV